MNFAFKVLTSTRFAVVIISLIILLAVIGTLYPGGEVFFGSPLFLALIGILAISTALCSLTRIVPLWRDIRRPQVEVSDNFLQALPYYACLSHVTLVQVRDSLQGYAMRETKTGTTSFLLAQKGRIGRFGPHIAHFGVLLLLLGVAIGAAYGNTNPYNNKIAVIQEGGSQQIDGFTVRLDNFSISYYSDGAVRDYTATVTVLDGNFIQTQNVTVNGPLTYKGLTFYLYGYGVAPSGNNWVAFQIKSTSGLPFVWAGAAIALVGIMLSLYVTHKKIWIMESDQATQLGAVSNKSSTRFFREIDSLRAKLERSAD